MTYLGIVTICFSLFACTALLVSVRLYEQEANPRRHAILVPDGVSEAEVRALIRTRNHRRRQGNIEGEASAEAKLEELLGYVPLVQDPDAVVRGEPS